MRNQLSILALVFFALFLSTRPAAAQDYQTEPGWALQLPGIDAGGGFFTLAASFPETATGFVDGYALAGRIVAASGQTLFLQRTFGASDFFPIATMDAYMDPSFVVVSPDGNRVAVGVGYMQPVYIFDASLLSGSEPPNLSTHPEVLRVEANYYDGIWRDSRYLLLNGGWYTGSALYLLDTEALPGEELTPILEEIPGASGGVTIDHQGNVITGIGADMGDGSRTGEIAILPASAVEAAIASGVPASYEDDTILLAHNVLSAANLSVDAEGNLFVGGGDWLGDVGEQLGFAAMIDGGVIARVLTGGAPLDPEAEGELTRYTPYPCDMGYSSVTYLPGVEMLLVSMDDYMGCAPEEGASAAYFSPFAPDDDGDGVPNGMDPDYSPRQFFDRDYLSAFVDSFGASAGQPNFVESFDLDDDGVIGMSDLAIVKSHWGAPRFR